MTTCGLGFAVGTMDGMIKYFDREGKVEQVSVCASGCMVCSLTEISSKQIASGEVSRTGVSTLSIWGC